MLLEGKVTSVMLKKREVMTKVDGFREGGFVETFHGIGVRTPSLTRKSSLPSFFSLEDGSQS